MSRRAFIGGITLAVLAPPKPAIAATKERSLQAERMTFVWRHADGRLFVDLSAPGPGWLAVGFNDRHQLVGMRFVIAAVIHEIVPLLFDCRLVDHRLETY